MSGIHVVIQRHTLLADFMFLPMGVFGVIFNMDWMSRYIGLIDCKERKDQLHLIISQRAQLLIERRCETFLACIVITCGQPFLMYVAT